LPLPPSDPARTGHGLEKQQQQIFNIVIPVSGVPSFDITKMLSAGKVSRILNAYIRM
jgi:hypothetical protein